MEMFKLEFCYICSLWSFCTIYDFKLNCLTFLKGFKTFHVQAGVMDKYIIALFIRDEAVSFLVVEPFYCTFVHWGTSFYICMHIIAWTKPIID